ncbi:hypothetical protein QBC39DRAFT_338126 [Podospora conica]|nr:hypothetical protein QBC39DRAFT_338126 [Schizothecium conicum]
MPDSTPLRMTARKAEQLFDMQIRPTIPNTSQVLLYKWMNILVEYYNSHLDSSGSNLSLGDGHQFPAGFLDPEMLRLSVDRIVARALEDMEDKMLRGTVSLCDFVITILFNFWERTNPYSLEAEFLRLWKPPNRVCQPPFARLEPMQNLIDQEHRPLDALYLEVVKSLEPQFKLTKFKFDDHLAEAQTDPYQNMEMEYREKLDAVVAAPKRRASSLGDSEVPSVKRREPRSDAPESSRQSASG